MEAGIVFFDGTCGFCSRWVAFILRWERSDRLKFCPVPSEASHRLLPPAERALTQYTLLLKEGDQLYLRSAAVFRLLKHLRWFWVLALVGRCVPLRLADWAYDFIARRRKRLPRSPCPLPTDPSRFLTQ